MKRYTLATVTALAFLATAASASAGTVTFVPGSPNVASAINSGGFYVAPNTFGLFGAEAWTADFSLNAGGAGYSDAGLVLFFAGGLTLGQLQSVSVVSTGAPLAVNLWLDTGGDGQFFSFNASTYLMTSLSGDSYSGCGVPTITGASSCYMLGGNGAGGAFTLAQLQGGAVPGIGANTPTALWIGIVGGSVTYGTSADISSITVTTVDSVDVAAAPVPEPATWTLLGLGLIGLAAKFKMRKA